MSTAALSRSSSASSLASAAEHPAVYVPVHKRRDASASPTPEQSWREHKPSRAPAAAFRSHKPYRRSPSRQSMSSDEHDQTHTSHIPPQTSIPARTALPHTYSIHALLGLSAAPAALAPEKLAALRALTAFTAAPSAPTQERAQRRRRTGRTGKKPQPAPAALQVAPVDTRRKQRHGHASWGWHTYATGNALQTHQHDLESPWRHAPQAVGVAA